MQRRGFDLGEFPNISTSSDFSGCSVVGRLRAEKQGSREQQQTSKQQLSSIYQQAALTFTFTCALFKKQ